MSLLPISQEDLALCAERWGWRDHADVTVCCWLTETRWLYFWAEREDSFNAAAILDRITHLVSKGLSFDIYWDRVTYYMQDERGVTRLDSHIPDLDATNRMSYAIVQLTLALPPEVWI